jgi:hypothetical protein
MIKISIVIEHLFRPMLSKCNTYSVKTKVLSSIIYYVQRKESMMTFVIVNRLCIAGCIRTQLKIIIG